MAPVSPLVSALGFIALGARTVLADCASYGMDFQNGGQYFQNSLSNDSFTFVSEFQGCEQDSAYNILVDPNADQLLCTDTDLQPDLEDMLSTCPIQKNELYSGGWSIIVLSNNGDSPDPIAFQRDFSLSVGPQLTSTVTPTVTVTAASTPLVNTTMTSINALNTTLDQMTVTSPSVTKTQTKTIVPPRVTTTSTKTQTFLSTKYTLDINVATKTETAKCKLPTKPAKRDPPSKIKPTVAPIALRRSLVSKFRRSMPLDEAERKQFIEERDERLSLVGRAPDAQPLIVTDADTAHWSITTTTSLAPAVTSTLTTELVTTMTITPTALTVLSGKTTAPRVTITAATPTWTKYRYTQVVATTTKVIRKDVTITQTTTPDAVKESCTAAGGILY